jgi:hypothetical protein
MRPDTHAASQIRAGWIQQQLPLQPHHQEAHVMTYSIHLIDSNGKGSYLSVKNRTTWKTKRAAARHLRDVLALIAKSKFPAVTADLEDEHGALIVTPAPHTLTLKAGPGCTPIHLADALIYIGADAIEAGEKRGDIETRGPWNIISSYKALATTATWKPGPTHDYVDEYTLHGARTLSGAKESGYNLEGTVSIEGQKRSAFTSSIMFQIIETGKLVDVAVIHARSIKEATKP